MSNEVSIMTDNEFCKCVTGTSKPDSYNITPPSEQKDEE